MEGEIGEERLQMCKCMLNYWRPMGFKTVIFMASTYQLCKICLVTLQSCDLLFDQSAQKQNSVCTKLFL